MNVTEYLCFSVLVHTPVQSIERLFAAFSVALVRALVCVDTDVDLEAVGRQKRLAAT
jgi:hypothetical protein